MRALFLCTLRLFPRCLLTISETDDVITGNGFSSLTAQGQCSPRERLPASGEFSSSRLYDWIRTLKASGHWLLKRPWNCLTTLQERCSTTAPFCALLRPHCCSNNKRPPLFSVASLSRWIIDGVDWVWWRLLSGTGSYDYSPFNYTQLLITILAESLRDGCERRGGSDWSPSAGTDKLGILTRNEGSHPSKDTITIIWIPFFEASTSLFYIVTQNILLTINNC